MTNNEETWVEVILSGKKYVVKNKRVPALVNQLNFIGAALKKKDVKGKHLDRNGFLII